MSKLLAAIIAFLGGAAATVGTVGCGWLLFDEPKMPKSLLKK